MASRSATQSFIDSFSGKLVTAAAVCGVVGCTVGVLTFQWLRRRELFVVTQAPISHPSDSRENALPATPSAHGRVKPLTDSPALLVEQLSRLGAFFGDEDAKHIFDAFVCVVGVGGVGSHAANMLARSGVTQLRLIDFDQVSLSSLNRHATATRDDVGTSKVAAMARTFSRIVPSCIVEPVQQIFEAAAAEELLCGLYEKGHVRAPAGGEKWLRPTFVVDCIDDTETKAHLLHFCYMHAIPVMSSLSAGGKADPTKLHIADLALVRTDPMGGALRSFMRDNGLCGYLSGPINGGGMKGSYSGGYTPATSQERSALDGTLGYYLPSDPLRGTVHLGPALVRGKVRGALVVKPLPGTASPSSPQAPLLTPPAPASETLTPTAGVEEVACAGVGTPISASARDTLSWQHADALRMTGIMCVYSSEPTRVPLLALDMANGEKPQDFGALPGFRVRVLPVLGTMPALFGQTLAAAVLCRLAGKSHEIDATQAPPSSMGVMVKLLGKFADVDRCEYCQSRTSLSLEDVIFLTVDVWYQRSALSAGDKLNLKGVELTLARWRRHLLSVPSNIVLVTREQAAFLFVSRDDDEFRGAVAAEFGSEAFAFVERRLAWVRDMGYP